MRFDNKILTNKDKFDKNKTENYMIVGFVILLLQFYRLDKLLK